jgi:1-acyl-sn-glycerol-3-phosphate acyltransferase
MLLRSILFNLFFFIWAPVGSLMALLVSKLSPNRKAFLFWIRLWVDVIDWGEKNILGLSYTMNGMQHLPPAPYIVAMQHQSAWEAMQVPRWFPNAAIVLKQELLDVPLWGSCMAEYGAIPVERAKKGSDIRRMLTASEKFSAEKRAIIIFPHGTRMKKGENKPIQRGVAVLYDHLKIPVVPITLNSGSYWNARKLFGFLNVHVAGTVSVNVHPAIPAGLPRAEMMKKLEEIINV